MLSISLFMVIYYLAGGFAIGFGLHRLLSHRSFSVPKWLEYAAITLSLPAGTPVQWVGNHRFHHAHTDEKEDPHSPHWGGFWHAHVGWYLGTKSPLLCLAYALAGPGRILVDSFWRPRTNQQYNALAADVAGDPYYGWLSRPIPYMLMMWLHALVVFGLAFQLAGWIGAGLLWAQLALMYNVSDAIDSVAHLFGEKPYRLRNESRNNPLLALLTLGEGWHANHHAFPGSARHGLLKGQFDWTWETISLLARCGLAWHVNVPERALIATKLKGS